MALRFIEGFEVSEEIQCFSRKWAAAVNGNPNNAGRLHGDSLATATSSVITEWRTRSLGLQNTWTVGYGFRHVSATVTDDPDMHILIVKRGTSEQFRVDWRQHTGNTWKLQVYRGATLIGETGAFVPVSWHYLEFQFTVDPTGGTASSIEIRVNTQVELNISSIDLADTGLAGADVFEINCQGPTLNFDDLYILDSTGSINNDFLGDSVIEGRRPTADSTPLDWNLENGGFGSVDEHWEALDATTCSGTVNTQYIWSDVVNDQDLLSFNALSFITGQIHCVQVMSDARLDAVGSREFKHLIRSNATIYSPGPNHTVASTNTQNFFDVFEVDPDTGVKWTIAGVNAAEFGVELVS